jgi:hypothetical protein
MMSLAVYEEFRKEDNPVEFSGTVKKRHRGRHLAAGRCGEPKKLTRGYCGSRRKLAAACRKVSRRAVVARRKGNIFRKIWTQGNCGPRKELAAAGRKMACCDKVAQAKGHRLHGQDKDKGALKTSKGRTMGRKQWAQQQGNKEIRKQDVKKLQLKSMGNFIKTYRKSTRLEIAKRVRCYTPLIRRVLVRTIGFIRKWLHTHSKLHLHTGHTALSLIFTIYRCTRTGILRLH